MLSASLVAAADLWPSSGEMTVEMMLEKNQILAAVGTLCYMSEVMKMYIMNFVNIPLCVQELD